ncbi:MAG: hypothetical protein JW854_04655 [Actinobacteria bacterium]|nr:hypothetical protein [Actinomycetota bacterium]
MATGHENSCRSYFKFGGEKGDYILDEREEERYMPENTAGLNVFYREVEALNPIFAAGEMLCPK